MSKLFQWMRQVANPVPVSVKKQLWHLMPGEFQEYKLNTTDPYAGEDPTYRVDGSPVKFGIVREDTKRHQTYVAACREMGLSYDLMDLDAVDWLPRFRDSDCDIFLVWPSVTSPEKKDLFDERLRLLVNELKRPIFPSFEEVWLYENKRRQAYWMDAHDIPQAKTWAFYNKKEALDFVDQVELPVLLKTNFGAGAKGVWVIRDKNEARSLVRKAFGVGLHVKYRHPFERFRNHVLFQEWVDIAEEWRMIRVGDSYFGFEKGRIGDFHSGTGIVLYGRPDDALLDLTRKVTELGNFRSLNLDIFKCTDGRLVVSELHMVWGQNMRDQLRIEDEPGRMVWDEQRGWQFEKGIFTHNSCANLRVQYVLEQMVKQGIKQD